MKKILAVLTVLVLCLAPVCGLCEAAGGYAFELPEGAQSYVEGLVFDGDVTIGGDNAQIMFVGCEFRGDVILTSAEGTRVLLLGSTFEDGKCVFASGVKESNIDASFPKFLVDAPVEVEAGENFGTVAVLGDFEVVVDGTAYTLAGCELFYDANNPEAGFVPYEGQEANVFVVAQWWENGEKKLLYECEYEPEG